MKNFSAMKKILAVAIAALMLVAIVPVVTANTETATLPAPVAAFNFENVNDFTFIEGKVTVAEGVATLAATPTPELGGGMKTTAISGINACEDITVFTAFKPEGNDDTWINILTIGKGLENAESTDAGDNLMRLMAAGETFYVQHSFDGDKKTETFPLVANQWIWVACAMDFSADGSKVSMYVYYSADEGATWNTVTAITDAVADIKPADITSLCLGRSLPYNAKSENEKYAVQYEDARVFGEVLSLDQIKLIGDTLDDPIAAPMPALGNSLAYTDGNKFASFIDLTDPDNVEIDNAADWAVKENEGAMGGSAIACLRTASPNSIAADGITVTFSVPADGEYTVWLRTMYPMQSANSLFYSVDDGDQYICDFPDEDAVDAACYDSWQYFYLTERAAGTYTDTNLYGAWTIQQKQWRHKPHTLTLTAGWHTIKFTGREGGMWLDEMIVTSFDKAEYDPNAFTLNGEINTSILNECKFCGPANKHYIADIFALKGICAESYFLANICPNATPWTSNIERPTEEVTTEAPTEEAPTEAPTEEATTAPKKDETTAPKDDGTEAPDTETKAPDNTTEKKGCGAGIATGTVAFIALAAIAGSVLTKKKKK